MSVAHLSEVELADELVRIVPVRPEFAPEAFELLVANDDILRWLVWDGPSSDEELAETFSTWVRPELNGVGYLFAILQRSGDRFLGTIGLRCSGGHDVADVGYWLAQHAWGRGAMTEAVRLVGALAFRHLGTRTLSASVFVGNEGSRRVLEKNKYALTHVGPGPMLKRGEPVEEWFYTLARHDFERAFEGWRPAVEHVAFDG